MITFDFSTNTLGFLSMATVGLAVFGASRKKERPETAYIEAIHLMLEGRKKEALDKLKKSVKHDTENIMAYIQLGVIYRETGFPVRAAKIHRDLLVRRNISEEDQTSILHHLVLDYQTSGALDLAIETAERLAQRDKKNIENKKLLLALYEKKGDWEKAFYYRQALNKWLKEKDQSILALYKVMSGLKQIEEGADRDGRIRLREATKLDKGCVPAYLYWGDSYRHEGRNEDALKIWTELTQKNPDCAHMAFDRLKDVLYELGRYGEIEQIFQNVIKKKPKRPEASVQFIELLQKQGRLDQAMDLAEQVLDQYPDSIECRTQQVLLLHRKGDYKKAIELAEDILTQSLNRSKMYTCSQCGHESSDPLWHCPSCHAWDSFKVD